MHCGFENIRFSANWMLDIYQYISTIKKT